jgi:hypothetical protein
MNELHEGWMKDGEINYIGKVDSVHVTSGDQRIAFDCFLSDKRVKYLNVEWLEFGVTKETRVALDQVIPGEPFSFMIGEGEVTVAEGDFTFTFISDNNSGTYSIDFNTVGKVYGEKYASSLSNRTLLGFELVEEGLYMQFSGPLNESDQGVEVYYNNGTEDVTLSFTAEELEESVLIPTPDFNTPLQYSTLYQPDNCMDVFRAPVVTPTIEKYDNVCLTGTASASSNLNDTYVASKAIDGNKTFGDHPTRWINNKLPEGTENWLQVDFNDTYLIEKIATYDGTYVKDVFADFTLYGFNGTEWVLLAEVTPTGFETVTTFDPIEISGIKFVFINPTADYLARFYEIEALMKVKIQ